MICYLIQLYYYYLNKQKQKRNEGCRMYISLIIMLSVNFFCNISSYDILAYITNNYIALIYYAKIVHLLCQFHAGKVGFSVVCQAIYSQSTCKGAQPICQSIIVATNIIIYVTVFLILVIVVNEISSFKNLYIVKALNETKNILTLSRLSDPIYQSPISGPPLL